MIAKAIRRARALNFEKKNESDSGVPTQAAPQAARALETRADQPSDVVNEPPARLNPNASQEKSRDALAVEGLPANCNASPSNVPSTSPPSNDDRNVSLVPSTSPPSDDDRNVSLHENNAIHALAPEIVQSSLQDTVAVEGLPATCDALASSSNVPGISQPSAEHSILLHKNVIQASEMGIVRSSLQSPDYNGTSHETYPFDGSISEFSSCHCRLLI